MVEISDLVFENDFYPNDPDNCDHLNKQEKMYCTLCNDCGTVVSERPRNIFYASQDEDGNYKIHFPK